MPVESGDVEGQLAEQVRYYRARAPEYDDWWQRRGRWDRGTALNRQWADELAEVRTALRAERPEGEVLELACGTGHWTDHLAVGAAHVTAVDVAPEMLKLHRARVRSPDVERVQADLFRWQPDRRFDFVFFGFWISHVPPSRFAAFWQRIEQLLAPGGRVFFVDNLAPSDTSAPSDAQTTRRRLRDGRSFEIVKVFYQPEALTERLVSLGWRFEVRTTRRFFLYAGGQRAD